MKRIVSLALAATFCSAAFAAESPDDFKINAFLSATTAWSNVDFVDSGVEPIYVGYIHQKYSFDKDSNVGIQLYKSMTDDVSMTIQLLAKPAQTLSDWDVDATWAFLKWEPNNNWQFRVGRIRTQPYMLADYIDVAYAWPWVRPPQEVYSQLPTELSNFTGIDGRFRFELWDRDFSIKAFFGQGISHQAYPAVIPIPGIQQGALFDQILLRFNNLMTFVAKYGDETFSVRAGYQTAKATIDPNEGTAMQGLNDFLNGLVAAGILGSDYTNFFSCNNCRYSFASAGYQMDWNNVVSMGEFVQRKSGITSSTSATGWYIMAGYRIHDFLPNITFARERTIGNQVRQFGTLVNFLFMSPPVNSPVSFNDVTAQLPRTSPWFDGGAGDQTSMTYGLRWDVIDGVALKAEFSHVHPDHGSPGLFNVNPRKSVNIYSLAVNAVI